MNNTLTPLHKNRCDFCRLAAQVATGYTETTAYLRRLESSTWSSDEDRKTAEEIRSGVVRQLNVLSPLNETVERLMPGHVSMNR